jgi:hypothetical protein
MNRILTQLTKGILTTLLVICCGQIGYSQALLSDDFNYTGNLTGNGWSAHSGSGSFPLATTTGLAYTGHAGSGVGNAVAMANAAGEDVNRTFTSQSTNGQSVYYSCLVNVTDAVNRTGTEYFMHFNNSGFAARLFARTTVSGVNFGVSNSSTISWGTTNYSRNTVYLVVVKYTIVTGAGNDPLSLWVFSTGLPTSEAAAGTAEVVNSATASTVDPISAIAIRQASTTVQPSLVIDAIRVGTTWASVVPVSNPAPTVTTTAATAISTTGATLNGSVNANGASTDVTFDYGTSSAYGTNAAGTPSPVTGTTATSVSLSVPSGTLTPNTQYNFRVVGASTAGTTNGSNLSFYTLAEAPAAPTVNTPTSTTLTVTLGADINPAATQYAIQETTTGNYVQANGSLGAVAAWQTSATWSSIVVIGLSPTTTYTFQVKARNGDNVETAFGGTASETTLVNSSPLILITGTVAPFTTYAGTPSFSKNYKVSATFLTDPLVITAPSPFQITFDTTTTWGTSLSITPVSGTITDSTVYVRFNPSIAGTPSGSITHVATGANNPSVSISGTAIDSEPSAQSVVTTSNVTNNSMAVQMTGGTGASRIVVASTSPVTYVPADGVPPTGVSSNYSLAADQSGNRVVYNGTGTSFTLSGLSQNTQYYLASFDYNGSGVTKNYISTNPGTANATTYLNPPTTAPTLSVRMKLDTLNLVFTGGNGARRLVVVSEGAGVTLTPTFGQTFTGINSDFSLATDQGSNNRVVYDGTGTTVSVTGIQRNTLYGIKVIEYNGTGAATSYFITSGATTTLTSADFQPYLSGTTYTQNFNTLPFGGTFTTTGFGVGPYWLIGPPVNATATRGWQFANAGTGDVFFRADSGNGNSGAIMSYGSTNTSTDRALGFLVSSTFIGTAGITFQNTSAVPLYTVSIGFDGEQYRYGGSTNLNQYKIQYALASNGILSGTWIEVPSLTYSGTSGPAGAVNGNLSPTAISGSFNISSSWLPGQLLTIRVLDLNDPGTDDGLAIDNFTFSAAPAAAPTEQDSTITFSSILTTSMDVNWLNGNGAARIVVINKTNSFTNPVDGNNPPANNVYSGTGEQVIYNGTGSTVNVSGLMADSTYYVRVFAYNGTGLSQVYATQTATGNPASQQTASANPPRLLKVLSINGGNAVLVNTPFSVTIQAIDSLNNPQNVSVNTTISLSTLVGSGILSGTTSAVMTSGTNSVTVSGMLYDTPEFGVQLLVEATAGATLGDTFTVAFDVYDVASSIDFEFPPTSAVVGTNAAAINVKAYRSDFSVDNFYTANVTLSKVSGPGTLTGTLTKAAIAGQASFTDIQFSAPGTYVVKATSGLLTSTSNMTILVTLPAVMNEVAIPQYFGSKTTATTNTNRTPVVACVSFDNLLPATTYNLTAGLGLTSEAATSMGAGSLWNGTAYALTGISNAFTTDATGSSGPVWISIQPSANGTRFGAGEVHNLRVALSTSPFGTGVVPQFISTATLTALDIPTTQYDAVAANDGAFLVAKSDSCFSGKFALAYSNDAGTGRPLSISGIVSAFYTNGTQAQLPGSVDSVYNNTALKGSFAFVIPTGANNPNGVRYVGIRNSAMQLVNNISDADGIWSSGANTTTATRRQVVTLSASEASMNTLTALSVSSTNVTCFSGNDGSAQAAATSLTPTITYSWSPSGGNAALASNLTAGTYSVVAVDTNGCSRSASATITQPALFPISVSNDGPDCIGDSIQLSATGGVSYAWTGPVGFVSTDQNPLLFNIVAANSGFYKVVITDAVGCTRTDSTSVFVLNCNCTPPVLTASVVNACNNTATGSIDLIVTGGVAPYTYSWSNGATTEDISGLLPGTYVVNVTDGVACIAQETFVVGNSALPVITPSGATTFCSGGSVDLTATAGNTYLWSNGETTQTISASTAGAYIVTVTTGTCVLTSAATTITVNTFGFTGTVYSENMGVPTATTVINNYTGWQNILPIVYSAITATTPDVRTSSASSVYAGASGGGNIFFANAGVRSVVISGINTLDYSGITMTFGLKRDGGTAAMGLEYSVDGLSWTALTIPNPSNTSWALTSVTENLPATANLRLRFTKPDGASFRVDDVKISGSTATPSIAASGALAVCGSGSVYLSANTATGLLWSTGATTKSILVNATGTYTYTATGANGCTSTSAPVNFTVNPEPTASVTSGTIQCNGGTTTVDVVGQNGTAPYTGEGTFTVSAGVYSYIVTDANGCDDTASVTINQPPVLTAAATPGIIACNGGTTSIDVTASGGTAPYTGTGTFATVSAGPYSYTVTDAVGCTATASGTLTEPTVLVATATEGTITCNGGTTTVLVTATGGTPIYNGTGTFTVSAGPYSYTVTDSKGCTSVASGTITQPTAVIATGTPGTIACNGGTTSVGVAASGGVGPYTGEGTFTVSAGPYSYTVTDANGCTGTATGTISEPAILVANGVAGTIACNGGTTTVVVTASGGTTPYSGDGSFTVSAGPYSYTVTDANGCTATATGTIIEPAALVFNSFTPTSGTAGTSVTISGTGMTVVTAVKFGLLTAAFTIDSDLQITATVPAGAVTAAITLESACGNVTSAGSFTVSASTVTLNLRVLLQGFYAGGSQMTSALLNQGVVGASATETDSVTVELHNASSPFATVYSKTGILDLDGDGTFVFPAGASGNSYYIVVLHRNHLQTWSKDPVTFGTNTTYDFSAVSAPRSSGQPSGGSTSTGSLNKQ